MSRREEFILSRKQVTIQDIMDRFLVSKATARRTVNSLLSQGRIKRIVRKGKVYFCDAEANRPSSVESVRREVLLRMSSVAQTRRG